MPLWKLWTPGLLHHWLPLLVLEHLHVGPEGPAETFLSHHLTTKPLINFYRSTVQTHRRSGLGMSHLRTTSSLKRQWGLLQKSIGSPLPEVTDVFTTRCKNKGRRILKDSHHPAHNLLACLPSGKRLRITKAPVTSRVVSIWRPSGSWTAADRRLLFILFIFFTMWVIIYQLLYLY